MPFAATIEVHVDLLGDHRFLTHGALNGILHGRMSTAVLANGCCESEDIPGSESGVADPDGAGLDETTMGSSSDALGVGLPLRLRFRAGSFACILVGLEGTGRVFLACSSLASRRMSGLSKATSLPSSN